MAKGVSPLDERLREHGFDPSAPAAEAVAKLIAMRGAAGVDDAMIAHGLSEISAPEAAVELAALEPGASGTLRREIRRALFKLRQRGIEAPAVAASEPAAPTPIAQDDLSALIS